MRQSFIGQEDLTEIYKKLSEIEDSMGRVKIDLLKNLSQMQESLVSKLGQDSMSDFEQRILQKLNEFFQALMHKFADKKDTKTSMQTFEMQLKNLYELMMLNSP
jgi:hypothetical protein